MISDIEVIGQTFVKIDMHVFRVKLLSLVNESFASVISVQKHRVVGQIGGYSTLSSLSLSLIFWLLQFSVCQTGEFELTDVFCETKSKQTFSLRSDFASGTNVYIRIDLRQKGFPRYKILSTILITPKQNTSCSRWVNIFLIFVDPILNTFVWRKRVVCKWLGCDELALINIWWKVWLILTASIRLIYFQLALKFGDEAWVLHLITLIPRLDGWWFLHAQRRLVVQTRLLLVHIHVPGSIVDWLMCALQSCALRND